MFRPISLSIVLALIVAPNAALLCHARCQPAAVSTSGCHHTESPVASSALQQDTCEDSGPLALGIVSIPTDDLRNGLSAPHTDLVILLPRDLVARSTFDARFDRDPERQRSLTNLPLPAVLRI